jgi:digeranylgeranylglycerophospholipid reductase
VGLETDVLIVGGGTAGSYIAWKLAELGFTCTVLERDELEKLGTDIGPFHMEEESFEKFGVPLPEGEELLHRVSSMATWSPMLTRSFEFSFPTLCMDKPLFTRRLHSYALDAGADVVERAKVSGLIMEGGILRGLTATMPEGEVEWRARLVIDASGTGGAVRTLMPRTQWFENDPVSDEDTIFVYMETWEDTSSDFTTDLNSFPSCIGWCAPGPGATTIVGVGSGGSFEEARKRHAAMAASLPLTGRKAGSASGRIPYRRPPFSLVDNSLMVVGDAACMNKPFSGEGVTSGFTGCVAAVATAAAALGADDLTRDALWPYNVEYFRGQGAKFAFLTAVLPAAMSLSADEMEALFSLPGIMTESGALALQRDFEIRSDPRQSAAALPGLLTAVAAGRISPRSLVKLAHMAVAGAALKTMYANYPETTMRFGNWKRRARFAWRSAERVKREYLMGA